jgi:mevalonate kinase
MSSAVASAPGKLMLFGEHAVIYGYPCIVTAVDIRVTVLIRQLPANLVSISTPELPEPFEISVSGLVAANSLPAAVSFVGLAVRKFWEFTGHRFGVEVQTSDEFVDSSGLGSSSAVTVATIQALAALTGRELTNDQIFKLSFDTVLAAQRGRGSGFDVAAAVYGRTIYFQNRGEVIEPIEDIDLPLMTIYSGVKASTTQYVGHVATLYQQYRPHVERIFANIAAIVDDARQALRSGDWHELGQLMNFNQGYLQALGVSTEPLDVLVAFLRSNGAWGAKLSGAGGGDCVIGVVPPERQPDITALIKRSSGYSLIPAGLNADGVRLEPKIRNVQR